MDWADDVAYSVHDIEDFHRCNALPWQRVFAEKEKLISHAAGNNSSKSERSNLDDAYGRLKDFLSGTYTKLLETPYEGSRYQREQLRRLTSFFIDRYIKAISINPDRDSKQAVIFDEDRLNEVKILKQITRDYIIGNPTLAAQQHGQQRIITQLFEAIHDGYDQETGYPAFLPIRLRYLSDVDDSSHARMVADCVASL